MSKRDTYPTRFEIDDIRKHYYEMRNKMVRAWNLIENLQKANNLDIPDDVYQELKDIQSFDASDRIFMHAVFQ
jgi:hypothetical protein